MYLFQNIPVDSMIEREFWTREANLTTNVSQSGSLSVYLYTQ